MRIKEILLEYNKDFLIKTFSKKFQEKKKKDHSSTHNSLEELLNKIENQTKRDNTFQFVDPYIKWIIQKYVTNKIPFEEDIFSKTIPYLLRFDSLKRKNKLKQEHIDINRIDSLDQLMSIVDEYREENVRSSKEIEKDLEKSFYEKGEAKLIYDDAQIKVVVPLSERASCFFGRHTKWCTAATQSENYFEEYHRKGELYIVLIKPENKRFQFHFETNQFMDERDREINPNELAEEYPKLWDIFSPIAKKKNSIILNRDIFVGRENMGVVQDFLEKDGTNIQYIKNPPEILQIVAVESEPFAIKYIKNPSEKVQRAAVRKAGYMIQFIENPSESVQMTAVVSYPGAIKYIENPTQKVQDWIVKNAPHYIKYINNPSPETLKRKEELGL